MHARDQDGPDELGGVRANLFGPTLEALRRPVADGLMRWGHVRDLGRKAPRCCRTGMRRLPLLPIEDLDRVFRCPHIDFLMDQGVGHAVEVFLKLDVIINVHARLLPGRQFIGLRRQWLQGRAIQRLEQLAARLAEVAHGPIIEFVIQGAHGPVQVSQIEEGHVPQAR